MTIRRHALPPFGILLLATILLGCSRPSPPSPGQPAQPAGASTKLLEPPTATLPDGTVIKLELAETPEEHQQGLMFRSRLDADRGMLFLFDQAGYPSFWMKNTLIPLDMVFLDASGIVVDIAADVPPCRLDPCPEYSPSRPATAVLELNAGTAATHHVTVGSPLRFKGVPSLKRGG